ncbi:phosphatase PAP2 family protein [Candidatus Woesearchaeota archaeon]|nr:phosphatase PAP2 family protein [Candidatus Woesearchaeota archaeon]
MKRGWTRFVSSALAAALFFSAQTYCGTADNPDDADPGENHLEMQKYAYQPCSTGLESRIALPELPGQDPGPAITLSSLPKEDRPERPVYRISVTKSPEDDEDRGYCRLSDMETKPHPPIWTESSQGRSLNPMLKKDPRDIVKLGDNLEMALPMHSWHMVHAEHDAAAERNWFLHMGLTIALTQGFKSGLDRPRPRDEMRERYLREHGYEVDSYSGGHRSMPSGHTSSAFSGAWHNLFRYGPEESIVDVIYAAACGLSRLSNRERYPELGKYQYVFFKDDWIEKPPAHHPEDVVIGMLIPLATAALFVRPAASVPEDPDGCIRFSDKLSFGPYLDGSEIGGDLKFEGRRSYFRLTYNKGPKVLYIIPF